MFCTLTSITLNFVLVNAKNSRFSLLNKVLFCCCLKAVDFVIGKVFVKNYSLTIAISLKIKIFALVMNTKSLHTVLLCAVIRMYKSITLGNMLRASCNYF